MEPCARLTGILAHITNFHVDNIDIFTQKKHGADQDRSLKKGGYDMGGSIDSKARVSNIL